jgi:Zn-dependent peptidase ImmA (M78 family)
MKPAFSKSRGGLSEIRRSHCKAEATKLLQKLWVQAPDEIDLEALAHMAGKLRIEEGGLENAEGRIVASASGGTIRVKPGLNPGRRRFTIAHEIGHFVLHPREGLNREDTAANFTLWNDPGEETEANMFAAELLMPEFLFKPRTAKSVPSLALIDRLAAEFSTSVMATAYQYVNFTREQVALVLSEHGNIKWAVRSTDFWPFVRTGALSGDSAAGEIFSGKSADTKKMVRTPAYAWLPKFENDSDRDIREDSRFLEWYDCIITLLWLQDDLSD